MTNVLDIVDPDEELRAYFHDFCVDRGFSTIALQAFDDYLATKAELHDEFCAFSFTQGVDLAEAEEDAIINGAILAFGQTLLAEFCRDNDPTIFDSAGDAVHYGPERPPAVEAESKLVTDTEEGSDAAVEAGVVDDTWEEPILVDSKDLTRVRGDVTAGGLFEKLPSDATIVNLALDVESEVAALGIGNLPRGEGDALSAFRKDLGDAGEVPELIDKHIAKELERGHCSRPELLVAAILWRGKHEDIRDESRVVLERFLSEEYRDGSGSMWRVRGQRFLTQVSAGVHRRALRRVGLERTRMIAWTRGIAGVSRWAAQQSGEVAAYFKKPNALFGKVRARFKALRFLGPELYLDPTAQDLEPRRGRVDDGSWLWCIKPKFRRVVLAANGVRPTFGDLARVPAEVRISKPRLSVGFIRQGHARMPTLYNSVASNTFWVDVSSVGDSEGMRVNA